MAYVLYLFVTAFIPVFFGEIDKSQTQVVFYNTTEAFDPFTYGFNFGVGFNQPLPTNIGSLNLQYVTKEWVGNKLTK